MFKKHRKTLPKSSPKVSKRKPKSHFWGDFGGTKDHWTPKALIRSNLSFPSVKPSSAWFGSGRKTSKNIKKPLRELPFRQPQQKHFPKCKKRSQNDTQKTQKWSPNHQKVDPKPHRKKHQQFGLQIYEGGWSGGGGGHRAAGRWKGKWGSVNYLQIFKEDICRYLEKISADMPGNLQVYAGKVSAKVSAGKVPCRKNICEKVSAKLYAGKVLCRKEISAK